MRNRRPIRILVGVVTATLLTLGVIAALPASADTITETMTDRCSNDVFISETYDNTFPPAKGIFLKRNGNLSTDWSDVMPVGGHTHIRWWCHSTKGNILDPGTWRIDKVKFSVKCSAPGIKCEVGSNDISFYTFNVNGWTAERSRCDSNSTRSIQARLGPDRLLQIRCLKP